MDLSIPRDCREEGMALFLRAQDSWVRRCGKGILCQYGGNEG